AHLLGGAFVPALLGRQLVGRGPRDGRAGGGLCAPRARRRARRAGRTVLSQRRDQLPDETARRASPRGAPAAAGWVGRGVSQAAPPRLVRLSRARCGGMGAVGDGKGERGNGKGGRGADRARRSSELAAGGA